MWAMTITIGMWQAQHWRRRDDQGVAVYGRNWIPIWGRRYGSRLRLSSATLPRLPHLDRLQPSVRNRITCGSNPLSLLTGLSVRCENNKRTRCPMSTTLFCIFTESSVNLLDLRT